jgi:hypothetical protein
VFGSFENSCFDKCVENLKGILLGAERRGLLFTLHTYISGQF